MIPRPPRGNQSLRFGPSIPSASWGAPGTVSRGLFPSIEEFDQFVGALEEASGSLPVEVEIADGVEAEDELEPASVPDEG